MAYRNSLNPVMGRALLDAILGALSTVPGAALLATPKLHLATAGPTAVTADTAVADWTEATFTGYAAFTITGLLTSPLNLPTGLGVGAQVDHFFVCSTAPTPPGQTIVGYWIDNGAAAFYLGELFTDHPAIVNAGDFLELTISFFQAFTLGVN